MQEKQSRRDFMKKGAAAGAAATFFRGASCEERALAQEAAKQTAALPAENASVSEQVDAVSGATRTSFALPDRAELKEKIPLSKIGGVTVSRIILGGNLIGGYAHSRDLFYVSDLIKAYHMQKKCIETFMIAEECGINAFLGDWNMGQMMADYWKWTDGKIQLIAQCPNDFDVVKRTIDSGAAAVYPNGETCDLLIAEEKFDVLEKFITLVRDAHLPVGLGAHRIETFRVALERGLVPDFWMKTFHPLGYWSARHPEEHDNVFCRRPDETREFMRTRLEPWIAFKTLAAGAVLPSEGFRFAVEGGADFLCVGMYDFQIVDDVNLYTDMMKGEVNRLRRSLENVDRAEYEEEMERREEENA